MDQAKNKNIRTLTLEELQGYFETIGEKKFRVKQVWEWLWQKHAHTSNFIRNFFVTCH
jgi:23S rRNA (adenine2503-C2)-methyltransferase